MFRSLRIRTKLAAALVIPLVALAVLSLAAISAANQRSEDAADRARTTRQEVDLATASIGPGGLISALQTERNTTSVELIGLRDTLGEMPLEQARAATDEAVADFRATIASRSDAVQAAYQPAMASLEDIADARARADAYDGPRETGPGAAESVAVYDEFSLVIDTIFDINGSVALGLDDDELRSGSRFIDRITRIADLQTSLIRTIGLPIADPTGPAFSEDLEVFGSAHGLAAEVDAIRRDLETTGTPAYRQLATDSFAGAIFEPFDDFMEDALTGEPIDVVSLLSEEVIGSIGEYEQIRIEATERLNADAEALIAEAEAESSDAADQAGLVRVGTIIVMFLAIGVTLVSSRSIARPLRRLADDAEVMAAKSLPEAVQSILDAPLGDDVKTPELPEISAAGGFEIAELAAALNTVQMSAAGLAIEQAVLRRNISDSFVNLGRRNQNLLSRQLESITEMEREESDPDELEKLFALDHLATRMRRNAESLLLLAGLEPHRQWSAPVALIDVIRGALGEVEDYAQVEISRFDEALVNGSAAADLTHLVAELLENALNFSPPGRKVTIAGARREHGYVLAIIDSGIGMEPEELAAANVRLAGDESFTVAPSRYLGHYVVGTQARRLGTPVTLQDTPMGGVTALIDITAALATDDPGEAPEQRRPELDRHTTEAAAPQVEAPAGPAAVAQGQDHTARSVVAAAPVAAGPAPAPVPSTAPAPVFAEVTDTTPSAPVQTTASGYTKRVRGTNAPRTDVISARGDQSPTPTQADDGSSTAEDMRSMLSGLQAGAQRAHAEVRDIDAERTEDQR